MSDFGIGISGIYAAHSAMTTIGNNIANVATEGYHRQKVNLRPNDPELGNGIYIGQGVSIYEPKRLIDTFLEGAILKQGSAGEQYSRELSVLKSIENMLGDMGGTGLSSTITDFYNTLNQLSTAPQSTVDQDTLVNKAAVLASQFNTIGTFLEEVETQLRLEAVNIAEEINSLASSVAEMNYRLQELDVRGAEGSNLRDQRDQTISEISKLIGVTTQSIDTGAIVDVYIAGFPIVMGTDSSDIEVSPVTDGEIGLSPVGVKNYNTSLRGGTLGGLFSINNDYLDEIKTELDTLAVDIITSINKLHVQGVPSYNEDTKLGGSFKSLDGWQMLSDDLSAALPPISDGTIHLRMTDTTTGVVRRYAIDVVAATDTMTSMAAKFDAIAGLTSSVNNSAFHIQADANHKFDFIPSPLPVPSPTIFSSAIAGSSVVSVGGIYTGPANENYTMTVMGNATVGAAAFTVQVQDQAMNIVDNVIVPAGYVSGTPLTTVNGLEFSFTEGAGETVAVNDTFVVSGLSSPTVSGVYTGDVDETYTVTVVGTGSIGVTVGLKLQVRNSAGDPVGNDINIGSGYVESTPVIVDTGQQVKLQMKAGSLVDGQTFQLECFTDTDTSDFLAVTGVNSFFGGQDASSMAVNEKFRDGEALISVSIGIDMKDNENIQRISQLSNKPMGNLGNLTHGAYYRKIATGLAQEIRVTTLDQEKSESVMIELRSQRDRISGVDINNEAAELMVYQQMFQSMAKYMNMVKENMEAVMAIL